jgi:hypothetical protein
VSFLLPPDASRLLGPERARAFEEGLSPLLARACDGPVTTPVFADRAAAYLTLLDALVLFRRDHELEPLHEDLYRRVAPILAQSGDAYDLDTFAQDLEKLRGWTCIERLAEVTRIRGYKDNRRESYRYRLSEDAVALVEWLEQRLSEKLQGRSTDSRDRLTDVIAHLREAVRCLDDRRASDAPSLDDARRAIYLAGAVDDAIDGIGEELLSFRAGMLVFTSRAYRIESLREILAWLKRYVEGHLAKLETLRDLIDERLHTLAQPRYRRALRGCRDALLAEDLGLPKALRGHRALRDTDDQLDAQLAFFAREGRLAMLCAKLDDSARAVLRKVHRHIRELERRSARVADLRGAIRALATLDSEGDPRLADMIRALVASAHGLFLRTAPRENERLRPPLPRTHRPPATIRAPAPLRPKAAPPEVVRALRAARDAELSAWLQERVLQGRSEARLSETVLEGTEAPRRWLDLARARHLSRGRGLARLKVDVQAAEGTATLGGPEGLLEAPDAIIFSVDRRRV